jgi:ubiquinone/menaquinone biosynthesis C-methylase UbiE
MGSADVKEQIRNYWDLRGRDYDRSPGHTMLPEVWKGVLAKVLKGKRRILDVGTGTGFIALLLAKVGYEVVGIDLSRKMLEAAREKAEKTGVDVEFKLGDAENLPFDDDTFDAVICRHLLWTLPNPHKAVKEWKRVVKPRGKVVAIEGKWQDSSIKGKIRQIFGRMVIAAYERRNPWRNYHYSQEINRMLPFYGGITPEKVVEIFENAGLTDISVEDLSWIRQMMLRSMPLAYRIAWGNRAYFMVEGFKDFKSLKGDLEEVKTWD